MTAVQTSSAPFGQWLDAQFSNWQIRAGTRRSLAEFANWLGVNRTALASWINGKRVPRKRSAILLATKLGDPVYELLGLDRPDPQIVQLQLSVGALPQLKHAHRVRKTIQDF